MSKSNKPKDEKIKVTNRFISAKEVKELGIDLKEAQEKMKERITKKLIILSGAGDPENEKYKKVYDVIVSYANNIGYDEVIIQGWEGQISFIKEGFLDFNEATLQALNLFKKIDSENYHYDVICRSFGTGVFLNVCQKLKLNNVGFVSLWGIPNYTAFYELFKEKIGITVTSSKDKGVNFNYNFFESIIPYELLLNRFDQEFKVNIVNGSEDVYSNPSFHNYLKETNKNKNFNFSLIPNLPHEVTEFNAEYLNKLFSEK